MHQGNTTAIQFSASEEGASFFCGCVGGECVCVWRGRGGGWLQAFPQVLGAAALPPALASQALGGAATHLCGVPTRATLTRVPQAGAERPGGSGAACPHRPVSLRGLLPL